ncbi:hypothetical protein [Nocardioides montaniterrae]
MTLPSLRTVDPREAGVAAALAGGVVVVLAYAAGFGIVEPTQVVAAPTHQAPARPAPAPLALPAPPVVPAAAAPLAPAPVPVPPPSPSWPALPTASPTVPPPSPTTAPSSAPSPATPTCRSLLGQLPVVGDLVPGATTSGGLLGLGSLLDTTLTTVIGPHTAAGVDCLTGSVARPLLGDCCAQKSSTTDGAAQ